MSERHDLEADSAFIQAVVAEDELGAVLRSHIFVEANLTRYLELSLPNPKFLQDLDLNYARKVDLSCALGLRADFQPALKFLGTLRNKFAHRLGTSLTKELVEKMYAALPPVGKEAVASAYDLTETVLKTTGIKDVTKLQPRDLFVMVVVSLERFVMAGIVAREFEGE